MENVAISNLGGGQHRFRTRLAILGVGFGPCMDANERGRTNYGTVSRFSVPGSEPLPWPHWLGRTQIRDSAAHEGLTEC